MQRAAVAAEEVATIAPVVMRPASMSMVMMMVCAVRRSVKRRRPVGAWCRHHPSQLGDHEQGRKQVRKQMQLP
jgi:hypothetical protein